VAISADSTTNLVSEVLNSVGAYQKLNDTACDGSFVSNRDALDDLMITYYNNGTGPTRGTAYGGGFVPTQQADVGGFPTLAAGTACTSSLHDGLNDQWKVNHGLSVTDPTLHQTVAPNGYTYLENYLNGTAP